MTKKPLRSAMSRASRGQTMTEYALILGAIRPCWSPYTRPRALS